MNSYIKEQGLVNNNYNHITNEEMLLKEIHHMFMLITSSYYEFYKDTNNRTFLPGEYVKLGMPYIRDDLSEDYFLGNLIRTAKNVFKLTTEEILEKAMYYGWSMEEDEIYIINDIEQAINQLEIVDDMLVYPERWFSKGIYSKLSELLKTFNFKRTKYKGRVAYKEEGEFSVHQVLKVSKELKGISLSEVFDFYPTPQEIVEEVQALANLDCNCKSILEPSAGTGNLVNGLDKNKIICVEFNKILCSILSSKGYAALNIPFEEYEGEHDIIIMNPPFGKRMDAKHIIKAFEQNLESGGTLVAIHSSGITTSTDKNSKKFQDICSEYSTYQREIPRGAFKNSGKGTMVNTCITRLEK